MMTEKLRVGFILRTSLSLAKREVGVSSNPFTNFGKDAVDKLFTEEHVNKFIICQKLFNTIKY